MIIVSQQQKSFHEETTYLGGCVVIYMTEVTNGLRG